MGCIGIALVILQWHRERQRPHAHEEHGFGNVDPVFAAARRSAAPCRCTSSCSAACARPSRIASSAPTTRCRRSAISPKSSTVSRITVRKAIDGLVEEGLLVRRQGSGTFVSNRVEKNFSKLTSFSEDMRARGRKPRSVWLNRAAGHGDAGRIAARCAPAPARRCIASTVFATPTKRRWRWSTRRCSRPACPRSKRWKHRCTKRWNAPAIVRCARCSGCARCCSRPSRRSCSRRRRTDAGLLVERARLSQGRPRGGVLAVLLSRRHLRFRRRAQRHRS